MQMLSSQNLSSSHFFLILVNNIDADVFNKLKGGESGFKLEYWSSDVRSQLSLYEATVLRIPAETIMDKAIASSRKQLHYLLPHLDQHIKNRVQRALILPPHKSFPWLEFRNWDHDQQDVFLGNCRRRHI